MGSYTTRSKDVYVRRYSRRRFGRVELVRQHWRSYPRQLSLFS
jgi:hypothetical protein